MSESQAPLVFIEVRGGCAYVSHKDRGCKVVLVDWDCDETGDAECPTEVFGEHDQVTLTDGDIDALRRT